jgi:hypothetical protein
MKDMSQQTLLKLCQGYDEAECYLIESVKTGLYALDQKIFETLDFYQDAIYLDPLFFACLNDTNKRFIDLLIGCYSQNANFKTTTDKDGKIYLPKYGVVNLNVKEQQVTVGKANDQYFFKDANGNNLAYTHEPVRKSVYDIEFFYYAHPYVNKLLTDSTIIIRSQYKMYFNRALEVIKTIVPEFFEILLKSVHKVVFIDGTDNSFAALETQGIIYLNVKDEYNEVFFVDDIIHQSAHVIFNTLTLHTKSKFFTKSYNTYLKMSGDKNLEGFYARFHGLYTMSLITGCLTGCYKYDVFKGEKRIELIGRIVDNMKKFKKLIYTLVDPQYFEEEATKWFSLFKIVYDRMERENKELITKYKVSNQPYVFDFDVFKATNSL